VGKLVLAEKIAGEAHLLAELVADNVVGNEHADAVLDPDITLTLHGIKRLGYGQPVDTEPRSQFARGRKPLSRARPVRNNFRDDRVSDRFPTSCHRPILRASLNPNVTKPTREINRYLTAVV